MQKLHANEALMYQIMTAIYKSRIPIDYKGSMVLRAFLSDADFEAMRHTRDIDANWISENDPTSAQMTSSIQRAMDRAGLDVTVKQFREHGDGKSAGFEFYLPGQSEAAAYMDMDVNRLSYMSCVYEIGGFVFRGAVVEQMIADKISALSGDKIFRRAKDLLDMYYISQVCELDVNKVAEALTVMNRELGSFDGLVTRVDDLRHAYDKVKVDDDVEKPEFDRVYKAVVEYIDPFMAGDKQISIPEITPLDPCR